MASARVFVSSVVEGFSNFREAARRAVRRVGAEPVLVNEDFPSLPTSPRNACLDGVASSDLCIALIGRRPGWTAPSGKPVVLEEIEAAIQSKQPVLVFIQRDIQDPEALSFADRLSGYVDGRFRREFSSAEELEEEIVKALTPLIGGTNHVSRDLSIFARAFAPSRTTQGDANLRVAIVPERAEEVVDPPRLESPEFRQLIYEIGHAPDVALFDFEFGKEATVSGNSLVIEQGDQSRNRNAVKNVHLQISELGEITIEMNLTGRQSPDRNTRGFGIGALTVDEEDIGEVLSTCLRFASALFDRLDPYKRHQRFIYNVGILNLGYRTLSKRGGQSRSSAITLSRSDGVIVAYEEPRVVLRTDMAKSKAEVERAITLIARKM